MGFVGMCGRRKEGRGGMKGERMVFLVFRPAAFRNMPSATSTNDGYSIVPPATDGVPARKPMMGGMRVTSG
jgi:hypothetical protein